MWDHSSGSRKGLVIPRSGRICPMKKDLCLQGLLGGLVGLCQELRLGVTGVCAGFRDNGVCTRMSVPGHSRVCVEVTGSEDTQTCAMGPTLAVVRVCVGGADLGLLGSVLDLGTSGVCMGPILAKSLLQGTLFPPGRVTLGHSCFSQGMALLLWDEWGQIWSARPIPQPQLCPFPASAHGHLLTAEQHLPLAPSPGMTCGMAVAVVTSHLSLSPDTLQRESS